MQSDRVFRAENPPKEIKQANTPQQEEVVVKPIVGPVQANKTYFAEYRIIGPLEQLKSVSKFLKDNGINYIVENQGEI